MSAGADFAIEVHREIAPLERIWRDLEERGAATAFQRYDFVSPLYSAFLAHRRAEPVIVLVRDGASGAVSMILPLCRYREGVMMVIGFADIRVADYCAPILARDFRPDPATFRKIWRAIARALPRCDLVRLRKLPDALDGRANPCLELGRRAPFVARAHGVAIAHPWRDRCAEVIPKRYRDNLLSAEKALGKLGEVTFEHHDAGPAGEAAFEMLYAMRTTRFAALGRDDAVADPMWAAFYRDLASRRAAKPFARLIVLRCGGRPVACGLGLVHEGAFLLLIPSFDLENFGRFSPGKLLIFRAMEAFAAEGLAYFDLTIGDEPYKRQFGTDDRELHEVVQPRSLIGRWAGLVWRLKVKVRRYPVLRARLRRLLRRG